MAKDSQQKIIKHLQTQPFSVATDGSNDENSGAKMYPVVVTYFDAELCKVINVLLSIPTCKESGTGENIFNLLDAEF